MLSLAKLTSSAGASTYFEVDDYYTKEEAQAELERTTSFQGKLANELQLPNFVDKQTFKDLLDGKVIDKDGNLIQELKQVSLKTGESVRSAGTDMTFSAPKSLSILAEVLGKEELSKIHDDAVSKTLSYIEQNLITTQIREGSSSNENSKITLEQTTKALFATFKHNTSRNLDPQLHTHAIAINITKRVGETKYRSTELKKIFENKLLLGAIYRGELAKDLINQGYEIHQTNIDGRFEIKNFPQELMEKFSTRRAEIEKVLAQIGKDDAKSSATITLKTRGRKVKTKKEVLQAEWYNTAKDYDLSNLQITKENTITTESTTKDLINHSISILTEKESAFTKENLLKQTLINNIEKGITITEVEKEIQNMLKEREPTVGGSQIIQVFQNNKANKDGILYTTKQEIHRELQLIQHLKADGNDKQIFTSKEELQNQIQKSNNIQDKYNLLTDGQKQAINHILTSKEQIIGIQGSAGTGKTYMLDLTRELLQEKGKEFIALAPSSSATKLLKDDANIQNNNTLQHFLTRYQRYQNPSNDKISEQDLTQTKEYFKNKVVILDESSLVSNKQMLSLINIAKTLDVKLILQGDTKQLSSVEAGKPFHQLKQAGMNTVVMQDILRQTNQDLKHAVELTINSQIKQAFQKIQNNIIEVEPNNNKDNQKPPLEISSYTNENPQKEYSHNLQDKQEMQNLNIKEQIITKTLETYFNLPKEERDKTLILTPANETRNEINSKVREELVKRNELDKTASTVINILKSKNISNREKLFSASYEKGDIVIFNKPYKSLNIKADEQLTVKDRDKESIVLQKQNSSQIIILPLNKLNPKTLEVYTSEAKELLKNEQIRFTKNDKTHNLINSHTAKVLDINNKENTINLKLDSNKTITLPQTELKHFDYAYASTAYSAQGKTANNVIAVLESYRKNLTTQQTFYVEISRAKNQAFLVTDNKEKLQQILEKQTGEKISVLTNKAISKSSLTQEQSKSLENSNKVSENKTIKTKDFDLER